MSQSPEWWSEWLGSPVARVHACAMNFNDDVGVLWRPASEETDEGWYLAITWRATAQDVAEGSAPEVNGILSAWELKIKFCPFCGVDLSH